MDARKLRKISESNMDKLVVKKEDIELIDMREVEVVLC